MATEDKTIQEEKDSTILENSVQNGIDDSTGEDTLQQEDSASEAPEATLVQETNTSDHTRSSEQVIEEVDQAVAEDSEDTATTERHTIQKKDYHAMNQEELVRELRSLLKNEKIQAIKEHVDEIRSEFNDKFSEELEHKKEDFIADGGDSIDFYYTTPSKKEFNTLYSEYKEKRKTYYDNLKKNLDTNLKLRLELIEELKGLLSEDENINSTYNHFKSIQERWRNAGSVPSDAYNTVWNTYRHHVENFYDYLHLNRDFRDLDFRHNLEQKMKLLERAQELTVATDVNSAFRELQSLHKIWKEDIGPVGKEFREEIWQKFSEFTKTIHENRQQYFQELDKQYEKNLEVKNELIHQIEAIANEETKEHSHWQKNIKRIESLRESFFQAGKVPLAKNQETWNRFKSVVRKFNRSKNAFYKELKKEHYENLDQKMKLIQIAEDHKDSEDYETVTPLMKKIQSEWRAIGHVPRKDSDRVWKQFKAACNHYFDRIHAEKKESQKVETEAFDKKKAHLESTKNIKLSGDTKEDLALIKENIAAWKAIGRVPFKKKGIEKEYNTVLDSLFEQLNMSRKESEMIKYDNKIAILSDQDDGRALRDEEQFIRKKIGDVQGEIRQLENNLSFFKHADENNPMVKDVHKNIAKHKETLEVWKLKLRKLKSAKSEAASTEA